MKDVTTQHCMTSTMARHAGVRAGRLIGHSALGEVLRFLGFSPVFRLIYICCLMSSGGSKLVGMTNLAGGSLSSLPSSEARILEVLLSGTSSADWDDIISVGSPRGCAMFTKRVFSHSDSMCAHTCLVLSRGTHAPLRPSQSGSVGLARSSQTAAAPIRASLGPNARRALRTAGERGTRSAERFASSPGWRRAKRRPLCATPPSCSRVVAAVAFRQPRRPRRTPTPRP